MGFYFYLLNTRLPEDDANPEAVGGGDDYLKDYKWLPVPILVLFTAAFNIGMGSLTWIVATGTADNVHIHILVPSTA